MSISEKVKTVSGKALKKSLGLLFVILSFWYLLDHLFTHFDQLKELRVSALFLGILFLSLLLFILSHAMNVASWWILQPNKKSQGLSFLMSCEIHFRSQIAKYLPGNVFHVIKLVQGATEKGLNLKRVLFVSTLQIILTLIMGFIFGLLTLFFRFEELAKVLELQKLWSEFEFSFKKKSYMILVLLALLIASYVFLFLFFKKALSHLKEKIFSFIQELKAFSIKDIIFSLVVLFCDYLLMGYIFYLVLNYFPGVNSEISYGYLTGSFAIAWVMGSIVPGAPGGMGVREAILLKLLLPFGVSAPVLVVFLLTIRLVNVLADVSVFFISFLPFLSLTKLENLTMLEKLTKEKP